MASVVYPLILFLFIFGAASTYINDSGLYSHKLPETGLASNSSQAQEYNDAMVSASSDANSFNTQSMWMLGKCVIGGVLAIFTLGPLLISYGIPVGMAGFLISPIGIIAAYWVVGMWLGR